MDHKSLAPVRRCAGEHRTDLLAAASVDGKHPRAGTKDTLRLVLADPDPLARRVVRESLRATERFVIAAEAKDGAEAVELAAHYKPELVLMEIRLPHIDGIEACRRIAGKAPQVRVVMFSVEQDPDVEMRALRAGASGFLSKEASIESIVRALRAVASGEAAISRRLTMHLVEMMRRTSENGVGLRPVKSTLTSREWEVLDLICMGAATRDIAATLFLSEETVYSHSKNILRKLNVHSRAEAVIAADELRSPTPSAIEFPRR